MKVTMLISNESLLQKRAIKSESKTGVDNGLNGIDFHFVEGKKNRNKQWVLRTRMKNEIHGQVEWCEESMADIAPSVVYAWKVLLKWKELRSAPAFYIHSFIFTEEGREKKNKEKVVIRFSPKGIPIYLLNWL